VFSDFLNVLIPLRRFNKIIPLLRICALTIQETLDQTGHFKRVKIVFPHCRACQLSNFVI